MASEFKVRNGLIVTGSLNVSESIYAENLTTESNPAYYVTWRQSDGRFEVSPAGAAGNINAIGCWDYAGYLTTPATGEFTLRSTGTRILNSNVITLQFHKTDNTSVDQSVYFNNIGVGSIFTLTTGGISTKYIVTGFNISGNIYTFQVTYLSGGPSATLSIGTEVCLTLTTDSCTATCCDSLTVDSAGIMRGGGSLGFTINVLSPLQATGLNTVETFLNTNSHVCALCARP